MFQKLTAIEPVSLLGWAEQELHQYAKEIQLFSDIPADDEEILRRIGDADAVLVSYTSRISGDVIRRCPKLKYIGMCCSLYAEESANVDIATARELGIQVLGVRDYGDRGVVEYLLHELIDLLHGFDRPRLYEQAIEITNLKVGIVGLGVSGRMIAEALQMLGAKISYYSRAPKPEAEALGLRFTPLPELLRESRVVCTCLNKNILLLGDAQFEQLGDGKILFNTSIGPGFDSAALERWVRRGENYFFCDTAAAAGEVSSDFFALPHVTCRNTSAGRTAQAIELLNQKVLDNLRTAVKSL